jgi:hypothetical protein
MRRWRISGTVIQARYSSPSGEIDGVEHRSYDLEDPEIISFARHLLVSDR